MKAAVISGVSLLVFLSASLSVCLLISDVYNISLGTCVGLEIPV